jgi:hypothetical protein
MLLNLATTGYKLKQVRYFPEKFFVISGRTSARSTTTAKLATTGRFPAELDVSAFKLPVNNKLYRIASQTGLIDRL